MREPQGVRIDPQTFHGLVTTPSAREALSAVTGVPLVIVEVSDAASGRWLADLDITELPTVVLILVPDPAWLPSAAAGAGDVVLTEDPAAAGPFAAPRQGLAGAVAAISEVLTAAPVAGASLALLLRGSAAMPVPAALVAESVTYSALQEGAEFKRWRSANPPRPPGPDTDRVRVSRSPGEIGITLDRPARRNAVDWRMRDDLVSALEMALAEPDQRVVLRGSGPDFSAGGDLDEFGSRPDPARAHLIRLTRSPAMLLHRLAGRTTARLHGHCLGAGIELPAFATRVVAAEDTKIALPEVGLGLIPGAGGTASLPRRIGRWRTAYLALSGDTLDAGQALAWGLADEISPASATGA
jgi:enoyl-CoA hydratase/carnithine racemase